MADQVHFRWKGKSGSFSTFLKTLQPWAMILMPFEFLGCNVFKKVEKLPDLPFQLKWTWSAMMSPRFYDFVKWLENLGLHSGLISFWLVTELSTDFILIASCNSAWVLSCSASKSVTLYSVYCSVKKGERKKIIYPFIYLFFFFFCMAALLACMRIRMGTHG